MPTGGLPPSLRAEAQPSSGLAEFGRCWFKVTASRPCKAALERIFLVTGNLSAHLISELSQRSHLRASHTPPSALQEAATVTGALTRGPGVEPVAAVRGARPLSGALLWNSSQDAGSPICLFSGPFQESSV